MYFKLEAASIGVHRSTVCRVVNRREIAPNKGSVILILPMHYVFDNLDVQGKKKFIEKGFGKGLAYDGVVYRTTFLNPIFLSKALVLSRKELLKNRQKNGDFGKIPVKGG